MVFGGGGNSGKALLDQYGVDKGSRHNNVGDGAAVLVGWPHRYNRHGAAQHKVFVVGFRRQAQLPSNFICSMGFGGVYPRIPDHLAITEADSVTINYLFNDNLPVGDGLYRKKNSADRHKEEPNTPNRDSPFRTKASSHCLIGTQREGRDGP